MTTTRSKSNQSTISEMRFYTIIDVWLNEHRVFLREALEEAGITTYRQLMKFLKDDLEDMLKVNALKNKKGEPIDKEVAEKLIRCYSYISLLQNGFGPIEDGLFDITLKDADDFETFYDNVFDTIEYDDDKARKSQADRIQRERDEANAKALHAEQLKLLTAQLSTTGSVSGGTPTGTGSSGQSSGLTPTPTGGTQTGSTGATKTTTSTLDAYYKSIKVDASGAEFPYLDEKGNWIEYSEGTYTAARRLRMHTVLDRNYKPVTQDDIDLFTEHQVHIIGVLQSHVRTIRGKAIVQRHVKTGAAQQAWIELEDHYTGAGAVETEDRIRELKKLIDTPLPPEYLGSLAAKITAWEGHLTELLLLEPSSLDPKTQAKEKLTKLERFLYNIPSLSNMSDIQDLMDVNATAGSTTYDAEKTIAVYFKRAQKLDTRKKEATLSQCRHIVNQLHIFHQSIPRITVNVNEGIYDTYSPDNEWYEIFRLSQGDVMRDSTSDSLQKIPHPIYQQLTSDERMLWSKFSNATKSIILNCYKHTPGSAPSSRDNYRSRQRFNPSSAGRDSSKPIAAEARVNATETVSAGSSAPLQANAHNANPSTPTCLEQYIDNCHEWAYEDTRLINHIRVHHGIDCEVNDTSHVPPFDMKRFLHQKEPKKVVGDVVDGEDRIDNNQVEFDGDTFVDANEEVLDVCWGERVDDVKVGSDDMGSVRTVSTLWTNGELVKWPSPPQGEPQITRAWRRRRLHALRDTPDYQLS